MKKGDAASVRPRHRRLVDQSKALLLQFFQLGFDVVDAQADVVNPLATLLDELRNRGVGAGGLEQLEVRIADGEKRGAHALCDHGLDVIDGQAEGLVDFRILDGSNSDSYVVEYWLHTPRASAPQMCLCSCVCSRAVTRSASIHSASVFISNSPHTGEKSTFSSRLSSTTRLAKS